MTGILHSPGFMALLAGLCTWAFTSVGAGVVFFGREPLSRRTLDIMLGFAAGVMIAASYWSLLAPALEITAPMGRWSFLPVALGFLGGAVVLRIIDMVTPHLHQAADKADGPSSGLPKSFLLILAITLHNIPEGLAVGVSMGASQFEGSPVTLTDALTLMLGIGLQNLPEGMAVSVPLLRDGFSRKRAFFYGQLSGFVEPVAAVLGAVAVGFVQPFLPVALAFAAGAMIFVVVEEVIPESQASGNGDAATMGCMVGFVVMMCMDVALS